MNKSQTIKLVISLIAIMLISQNAFCVSDSITLINKKTYNGIFKEFKSGRFYFTPTEGKELHEMKTRVKSLSLNPSSKVIVKEHGKSKRKDLKLKGYEKSKFFFEDASGKELILSRVTIVEMGLDFSRAMNMTPGIKTVSGEKEVDLKTLTKVGYRTIIHFHLISKQASSHTRQENYVGTLVKNPKDKIEVVKIEFKSWESPVAKQYEIKSTPQFWFYNKTGKLTTKLVERFTAEDIDAALKKSK